MHFGTTPLDGFRLDQLQNEPVVLPVEVRAEFVARLVDAGHTVVETTSFVPAKVGASAGRCRRDRRRRGT
jgi:hydroxymethylglutaryl-CoA lyase